MAGHAISGDAQSQLYLAASRCHATTYACRSYCELATQNTQQAKPRHYLRHAVVRTALVFIQVRASLIFISHYLTPGHGFTYYMPDEAL